MAAKYGMQETTEQTWQGLLQYGVVCANFATAAGEVATDLA
jgi:hypothetical protein